MEHELGPIEHASPQTLTYQEFLDFIADKEGRYEYVDGHAIAMGTPSDEHQDIALIMGSNLREHLRGQTAKYGSRPHCGRAGVSTAESGRRTSW